MARKKQRENYGNGSVTEVKKKKLDADGNPIIGKDGKPEMVQERDKQGRPIWRICITLGTEEYIDKNGKKRKRQIKAPQKLFHGTLNEARKFAEQMSKDYEQVDINKAKCTFATLCDEWLKSDDRPKCSESQLRQYKTRLGYISNYFDDMPLIEIKRDHVKSALYAIQNRQGEKPLSNTTMQKVLTITNRVFEYAIDEEYIVRNPCRKISYTGSEDDAGKKDRRSLSELEAAKLRSALDEQEEAAYADFNAKEKRQAEWGHSSSRTLLRGLCHISSLVATRIMLATGARRGETLGLIWGNVDLNNGIVRIAQSLNTEVKIKAPKTEAGVRSLYIDSHTLKHLRKWKAFQEQALSQIVVDGKPLKQGDETPVFTADGGSWIDPTNYSRWWRELRSLIGFDDLLTHELRHTQVTLLRANGAPDEMVKERIGHSWKTDSTTPYLHELPARDKLAADVMGRILYGPKTDNSNVIELRKRIA